MLNAYHERIHVSLRYKDIYINVFVLLLIFTVIVCLMILVMRISYCACCYEIYYCNWIFHLYSVIIGQTLDGASHFFLVLSLIAIISQSKGDSSFGNVFENIGSRAFI